jgi:hypothetical protein
MKTNEKLDYVYKDENHFIEAIVSNLRNKGALWSGG